MTPFRPRTFIACVFLGFAFLLVGPSHAHRVSSVSLISYLDTKTRTYTLDAAMEVVPSEDAAVNEQISPEDAAREFAGYLVVMFDQAEQKPTMEISLEETSDADTPPELKRQQVLTKLKGKIPEGANEFLLYLDPRCPMAVVMVVVKDEQPSRRMQVILSGEYSRPVSVLPVEEGDPFEAGKAPETVPATAPAEAGPAKPGAFVVGWWVVFGKSVLPALLVVAMLLLTLERSRLTRQAGFLIVSFGSAASLVLISEIDSPDWAAQALAVTTAALAIEALLHREVKWWRHALVAVGGGTLGLFLAGLPPARSLVGGAGHGYYLLGCAMALNLVGLAAFAVLLPLSRFEGYRKSVVTPLAVLIAGYAIFATVEVYL